MILLRMLTALALSSARKIHHTAIAREWHEYFPWLWIMLETKPYDKIFDKVTLSTLHGIHQPI